MKRNDDFACEVLSAVEEIPEGRLTPGWNEQTPLLQGEGIALKDAAHVELKRFQWDV